MTPLRDKAIDVVRAGMNRASEHDEEVVDVLLAAGMLTDPEECARTYSLISELIATGKDDDAERAYRLAVKAWRRARDVADGKPLPPRDDEARDAGKALDARLLPESDKEYCRRIEEIAAGGHPLVELPRDDEARIERAARADEAVDVVTRVCREADSWFVADGGSTRHWARDHFLPALRAEGYVIALAAADQEDTDA